MIQKPEVRPAPAPPVGIGANSGNGGASRPESSWDTSTQLVLPAPNKDISLTAQRPEVQLMLQGTINVIKLFLFLVEFYPVMAFRVGWVLSVTGYWATLALLALCTRIN
jgi:hypothetical protein